MDLYFYIPPQVRFQVFDPKTLLLYVRHGATFTFLTDVLLYVVQKFSSDRPKNFKSGNQ
jgi:hypothetical protein